MTGHAVLTIPILVTVWLRPMRLTGWKAMKTGCGCAPAWNGWMRATVKGSCSPSCMVCRIRKSPTGLASPWAR